MDTGLNRIKIILIFVCCLLLGGCFTYSRSWVTKDNGRRVIIVAPLGGEITFDDKTKAKVSHPLGLENLLNLKGK